MRRLVVLLSSIVALDIAFFAALTPLLPHFVSTYGLSKAAAGVLSASYAAGVLAASLPSGSIAARWGPRRAALVGVSLTTAASVAFAFADSAWMLGGARFLQGVGSALSWSGALAWLVGSGATRAARRADRGDHGRRGLRGAVRAGDRRDRDRGRRAGDVPRRRPDRRRL